MLTEEPQADTKPQCQPEVSGSLWGSPSCRDGTPQPQTVWVLQALKPTQVLSEGKKKAARIGLGTAGGILWGAAQPLPTSGWKQTTFKVPSTSIHSMMAWAGWSHGQPDLVVSTQPTAEVGLRGL